MFPAMRLTEKYAWRMIYDSTVLKKARQALIKNNPPLGEITQSKSYEYSNVPYKLDTHGYSKIVVRFPFHKDYTESVPYNSTLEAHKYAIEEIECQQQKESRK